MMANAMLVIIGLLQLQMSKALLTADLSPLSLTVGEDAESVYEFRCTVTGANQPVVRINEGPSNDQEIIDRGVTVTYMTIDEEAGEYYSVIIFPATIINNDTDIECIAVNFSTPSIGSPVGKFLVQGLLEAPTTEIATVNDSYLSFSWRAPFSLDITGVEPDIQFYTFRESLTGSSGNVTAVEEYVFPNVAVTVDFSVSAWNLVGEGTQASETHQACSLTEEQQTVSSEGVKSEVTYHEDMTVSLTLSLDWSTNCFPLLTVELVEEGREEGGKVTHSRLVPRVTSDRELHLTLPLEGPDNTHYTAQLTSISDQRELTVENPISFSTHDVQVVIINFTPTSITTSCQFAVGSPALGCSVHIFNTSDTEVGVHPITREANGQGLPLMIEETVEGLESGVYTVRVYDIESDGQASTQGAPAHTQTVDITQPTTPPPPDTTDTTGTPAIGITVPLSTEDTESTNTLPIIAGGVVGGVMIIAVTALVVISVLVCVMRRRKKEKEADIRERDFVLISTGTVITPDSVLGTEHLSPAHTLQASALSSPTHTLPGSNISLQAKEGLPPTYYELETSTYKHMRSMSDDATALTGVTEGRGRRNTVSQMSKESQVHLLEDIESSPYTADITSSHAPHSNGAVSAQHTGHTNLYNHQRSSSLGGHSPPPTSSHLPHHTPSQPDSSSHPHHSHTSHTSHTSTRPPLYPPKRSSMKRTPTSTPNLRPPPSSSPPPPIPTNTLTSDDILSLPTGADVLGGENDALTSNPVYDRAGLLSVNTTEEKKRRSIYYTEVVRSSPLPPSTGGLPVPPRDKEVVMYSELNIREVSSTSS